MRITKFKRKGTDNNSSLGVEEGYVIPSTPYYMINSKDYFLNISKTKFFKFQPLISRKTEKSLILCSFKNWFEIEKLND